MNWEAAIVVGRVARPQGIRGEVVVAPETDFVDVRFAPGATVWIERRGGLAALTVQQSRLQGGRPVVKFDGVETRNDAEALRGAELRVPAETRQALPPGVHYVPDLVGSRVTTIDGAAVGVVTRVDQGGGVPLLVVEGARGEVLVPLAEDICRRIDTDRKEIAIAPPAGLLELNDRAGR